MVRRNNAGKECCIAPAAAVWPLGVGYTTPAESPGQKAEETPAPALRACVRRFKTLVTPFSTGSGRTGRVTFVVSTAMYASADRT